MCPALAWGRRLPSTAPGRRQEGARFALFLLSGVNLLNFADRYIPVSTKELFKHDLHLTDVQTSLQMTGLMVVFMVTALMLAVLVDREICDRRLMLAVAVAFWSAMSTLSGMSQNFMQFFIFRSLIGVGEGAYMTIVPPILADFYPLKDRNLVYTVYQVCAPLGGAIGFTVGALLGADHSWRTAFMAMGIPGLLVACCIPCINDPARGVNDPAGFPDGDPCEHDGCTASGAKDGGLLRCFGEIVSVPHWTCIVCGSIACSFLQGGLADWGDTWMVRTFPQEGIKKIGVTLGAMIAVGGVMGPIVGCVVVERVQTRVHNAPLYVSSLFMIPTAGLYFVSFNMISSVRMVYLTLFLAWTCLFTNAAILQAVMVNCIPVRLRAMSQALAMTLYHTLGDVISPPIIGAISDSTGSLHHGMQLVWIMALVAALVWMVGWLILPPLPGEQRASSASTIHAGSSLYSLLLSDDSPGEANALGCSGDSYASVGHATKSERA